MPSSSNTKVSNFWRPSTFIAICLDLLTPKVADLWSGDVHPVGFFSGGGSAAFLEGGKQKVLIWHCVLCREKLKLYVKKQRFLSSPTAAELMHGIKTKIS